MTEVQQRTAEQLFRTLGDLKGGAMKMGQALSILESALPEEIAAPYREQLTRLQDSAPPMSAATVHDVLATELGTALAARARGVRRRPRRRRLDRPGAPRPLVRRPRGRGQDPVPRRRRGAARRPAPDRPGGPHLRRHGPRHRHQAARSPSSRPGSPRSSTTPSRRRRSETFAAAFRGDPELPGARRGRARTDKVLVSRVGREPGLAGPADRRGHPGGAQPLRRALRPLPVRGPGARRHAARRPAPRQLPGAAHRRRRPRRPRRRRLRRGRPAARAQPPRQHRAR